MERREEGEGRLTAAREAGPLTDWRRARRRWRSGLRGGVGGGSAGEVEREMRDRRRREGLGGGRRRRVKWCRRREMAEIGIWTEKTAEAADTAAE